MKNLKWLILGVGALFMLRKYNEIDLMARTAWGEARNQGEEGMQAVCNVIMNRVNARAWYSGDVIQVITKHMQFTAWNEGNINRAKMLAVDMSDPQFRKAYTLATRAVAGVLPDITDGATHYKVSTVYANWAEADKLTAVIGAHSFYAGIA